MGLAGLASDLTLPRYVSVCVSACVCLLVSAIRVVTVHADSNAGLVRAGNLFCTHVDTLSLFLSLEFESFVTKCAFVKKKNPRNYPIRMFLGISIAGIFLERCLFIQKYLSEDYVCSVSFSEEILI